MEEPIAAVDAMTRLKMKEELGRVCATNHKTVFFIKHSVEEAVLRGDRVLVMTKRPGTIKATLDVPRHGQGGRDWDSFTGDPEMRAISEQVMHLVHAERV